uniref:PiggyBac transposable element-derived protein domain-containing protein n=1 Tax=Poecilia reticulata TaxID=8081 RepID=A0A3P9N534_POERE
SKMEDLGEPTLLQVKEEEEELVQIKEEEEEMDEENKDEDALVPSVEDGGTNSLQSPSSSSRKVTRSDVHSGQEVGWRTEQESDRLPRPAPPFLPNRRPGVQPPLSHADRGPSPAELFKLYFHQAAIRTLSVNTNKNATDVSEGEMYQYIGLLMYTTGTMFQLSHPSRGMSRDRFLSIRANLHLSDPEDDAVNDRRKGSPEYDCLHRLRPLYDSVRVACRASKKQTASWGIKLFVLCDSSGYTWTSRFTPAAFLGSGYHVYCDGCYSSPALFSRLHDLGSGACGTFRDTRVGVPNTKMDALTKQSPRGSIRWIKRGASAAHQVDGREAGQCVLHPAHGLFRRRRQTGQQGWTKAWSSGGSSAGGCQRLQPLHVGRSDQLTGSASWPLTVLQHLVDVAVRNGFLLHREPSGQRGQQVLMLQAFQEQLTAQLCGEGPPPAPTSSNLHHLPGGVWSEQGHQGAPQVQSVLQIHSVHV